MSRVLRWESLRNEIALRRIVCAFRTFKLDLEPFTCRYVAFKHLNVEINAIVGDDAVHDPAERLKHSTHLGFTESIDKRCLRSFHGSVFLDCRPTDQKAAHELAFCQRSPMHRMLSSAHRIASVFAASS